MIDAWTIKDWLLICLVLHAIGWAVILFHLLRVKRDVRQLLTESELVHFLKAKKGP